MRRPAHVSETNSLKQRMKDGSPTQKVSVLFEFLEERGQGQYDERVTQLQHALQCAHLARQNGGQYGSLSEDVTSALLHDLGHLFYNDTDKKYLADDINHEDLGADFLSDFFPDSVTVPIRLHVPAKRYLCTVDDAYHDCLSDASKRSLEMQGGVFSDTERAQFESTPHLQRALELRRWDDAGKKQDLDVPGLEEYQDDVLRSLR